MAMLVYYIASAFIILAPEDGQTLQEEKTYTVSEVSVKPEPPIGLDAFQKKWSGKVSYPDEALREGVQGMVFIQFTVEKDGSIRDASVRSGIGYGCDEAALEGFRELAKTPWKPGVKSDQPVKVKMVLPFYFRILKM
jgi:protein TonB